MMAVEGGVSLFGGPIKETAEGVRAGYILSPFFPMSALR